ncbi:MAG: hypothetical protein NTW60_01100 [Candidatus Wolfebacteria bacterium]|nr:hypothetical protein [Candidatus Wolfebacteria bacterium]
MIKKLPITNYQLLLFLIIIIASFFRLYNITQLPPGLYPDEAMNGTNAQEALATHNFKVFYPENNGREGMFINIQAISVATLGNFPWALRGVSALFGIFTVLGIYFLAKELLNYASSKISEKFKTNAALLSAFLLAINFWHINFSRISFRAIMAPAFLTWSLYFFFKALNQVKNKSQAPSTESQTISNDQNYNNQKSFGIWDLKFVILSILGGLMFGLGFHSYIAFRAMPALMLVIFFYDWFARKDSRKKLLVASAWFILATFIIALPIGIYFLKNPADFMGRTTQVSIFASGHPLTDLGSNILKTSGMFNIQGDWNWRHNFSGRPELDWLAGVLFLIGIAIAIKNIYQSLKIKIENYRLKLKNTGFPEADGGTLNFAFLFLISFLIIAALPVVVSNEGIPHALRSIIMIPPVFILAGIGGAWILSRIENYELRIMNDNDNKKVKVIIHYSLFIILALSAVTTYYTYFIAWANNPNVQGAFAADYAQIGRDLNALPKDMPKYVVVPTGGVLVRGIPMPSQTVMFITDTFTPDKQTTKNIHYVLPDQASQIPTGAYTVILK